MLNLTHQLLFDILPTLFSLISAIVEIFYNYENNLFIVSVSTSPNEYFLHKLIIYYHKLTIITGRGDLQP
jgi:hypothetical protein